MKKLMILSVLAFVLSIAYTPGSCQIKTVLKTEQIAKDSGITNNDSMNMNTGLETPVVTTEPEPASNWADKLIIFLESSFGIVVIRSLLRYWPTKWNIDVFLVVRKVLEYSIKFLDIIYGGFVTNRKSDGTKH